MAPFALLRRLCACFRALPSCSPFQVACPPHLLSCPSIIHWCVFLYLSTDFSYILRLFTHISIFYNTTTLFRFASASAQRLGTFTLDMRTLIDFSLTYYSLHPIILHQYILWIYLYSLQHNHCATFYSFATSSLEKILRDLHATSASSLPPIARLFRLCRAFAFRRINARFAFTSRLAPALCADSFADSFSASPRIY
jgi:hypothetical protein